MSIGEGWAQGTRQGEKIGGVIFIGFRVLWFFIRVTWWLGQFLIFSLVAGAVSLVRLGRPAPDQTEGFGQYSPDRTRWQDAHSGRWYPLASEPREHCVVQGAPEGLAYRRNAISRLVRRGAIFRHTFSAVSDGGDAVPNPAASADFIQEMRHNITLDNLDPEQEDIVRYDLHNNYAEAKNALDHLDWVLTQRGWQDTGDRHGHWYARVYERSILWDSPIPEAQSAGSSEGQEISNAAGA
jgi:hypothetical protein